MRDFCPFFSIFFYLWSEVIKSSIAILVIIDNIKLLSPKTVYIVYRIHDHFLMIIMRCRLWNVLKYYKKIPKAFDKYSGLTVPAILDQHARYYIIPVVNLNFRSMFVSTAHFIEPVIDIILSLKSLVVPFPIIIKISYTNKTNIVECRTNFL